MSNAQNVATYKPVVAIFSIALLMAMATSWYVYQSIINTQTFNWFIAISMCLLAVQKLQDIKSFCTMFITYDLLAKRWPVYGYIYPFAEAFAGILMIAGALTWLAAPVALFIGTIGAISVYKAIYMDNRKLKCACVGGRTNVPLGFFSLVENVMMFCIGLKMLLV